MKRIVRTIALGEKPENAQLADNRKEKYQSLLVTPKILFSIFYALLQTPPSLQVLVALHFLEIHVKFQML